MTDLIFFNFLSMHIFVVIYNSRTAEPFHGHVAISRTVYNLSRWRSFAAIYLPELFIFANISWLSL